MGHRWTEPGTTGSPRYAPLCICGGLCAKHVFLRVRSGPEAAGSRAENNGKAGETTWNQLNGTRHMPARCCILYLRRPSFPMIWECSGCGLRASGI